MSHSSSLRLQRARGGKTTATERLALSPNAQFFDDSPVAREIVAAQIFEEAASFADEAEQATSRMVILDVSLEVLRKLFDARREERYLNFG